MRDVTQTRNSLNQWIKQNKANKKRKGKKNCQPCHSRHKPGDDGGGTGDRPY